MIAYFFHFYQSDFRDLWGHGEVGWLAAKKSAGRQRISPTSPFTLPFSPAPWRGGSEFQPLPPFALPFRLLAGFKGNGFRRVSLFTLPFSPAPWRGGNGFQCFPPFALPFRLLAGFKSNGFRRLPPFALPFSPAPQRGGNGFQRVSPICVAFPATPPKTNFFAKPIVTPPPVWYNTGYHRIAIQGIIVCFQACLHDCGTSFETLVQSTGMEI